MIAITLMSLTMSNDFTISEFIISKNENIPLEIADKILKYHIPIIQPIRDTIRTPIWPSENSGYRTVIWEKNHGRNGTSQHCFKGNGAVDYTCDPTRLNELFHLLCRSKYTRVCFYPTFIHCDFAATARQIFTCSGNGEPWLLA